MDQRSTQAHPDGSADQIASSLSPITVDSFSPVREAVFARLRQAILSGELAAGSRLVERELAEQLGVSRTPVREAFRKLEQEGLVAQFGRRNLIVRELSVEEVREILAIRAVLEGLAAELAAQRARPEQLAAFGSLLERMETALAAGDTAELGVLNERFHGTLYAAAGSRRLSGMLDGLREQAGMFAQRGYRVPGRAARAVAEHRSIVAAIAGRDPEAAQRAAQQHVWRSEDNLVAGLPATRDATTHDAATHDGGAAGQSAARSGPGPAATADPA